MKEQISFEGKKDDKGFIWRALIFGVDWAVKEACPRSIFAKIGAGEYPVLFKLAGALISALLYNLNKSRLPH